MPEDPIILSIECQSCRQLSCACPMGVEVPEERPAEEIRGPSPVIEVFELVQAHADLLRQLGIPHAILSRSNENYSAAIQERTNDATIGL